jgi:tetratricopeptide (TPR) repeat protein
MMTAFTQRLLCGALLAAWATSAHAQDRVRLIEDVGVSEQPGYVAVTLLFGCTMRYVSHTPASSGDAVQVRLSAGPDCGTSSSDIMPPLAGAQGTLRSLDVVRPFGTDVELRIGWMRAEQFVMVPSFNGKGLRIRLLRSDADRSKVTVKEVPAGNTTYAVNLESSLQAFAPEALAAAAKDVGVRVYVSEVVVDDQRWYRLRAGPFVTEADAKRALATARAHYSKAWIAIADDEALTAVGTPNAVAEVPVAPEAPSNTTLTNTDIDKSMKQARDAFRHKNYAAAIPLLTQLLEQPEFPQRAEAQELLGLSRERSGQLAHAKAEYEEYLRRYPQGEAAERVRKRLRALALATRPGQSGQGGSGEESPWRFYGGFSQLYRRDTATFKDSVTTNSLTTQNALLNDVGLVARRRGERFDFSSRINAGYSLDMLSNGPGDQSRVTTLFAELTDRELDWTVRMGRQSGNAGGLLGTFDGLYAGYQVLPRLRINANLGYPVESTRSGIDTNRRFYGLSADVGTFANAWDFSVYALSQDYYGMTDRQAVGTEIRYFKPGLTFVGMVDYDIHYQSLNNVLLLGTIGLPDRWTLNLNLDRRTSPSLMTRNAMIGQPVKTFDELFGLYSNAEIQQLARDRTADSDTYTISVSRPFGERWQWTMDVASMTLGGTPASGGVAAIPAPGTDLSVATQLMGFGLFGRGDVNTAGLQYQTSDTTDAISLGLSSQFPVGESWRIGPRLRVDQRDFKVDGSQQMMYSPSLRTEFRTRHWTLEFEGGAEIGSRSLDQSSQDTTRYYMSLGYRYDF